MKRFEIPYRFEIDTTLELGFLNTFYSGTQKNSPIINEVLEGPEGRSFRHSKGQSKHKYEILKGPEVRSFRHSKGQSKHKYKIPKGPGVRSFRLLPYQVPVL